MRVREAEEARASRDWVDGCADSDWLASIGGVS